MRREIALISLLVLSAALAIAVFACTKEETEELTVDEILARGKQYLVDGDGLGAEEAFEAVLQRDPEHKQAKFGIILANMMKFSSLVDELIDLLAGFDFTGDATPADEGYEPQGDDSTFSDEIQIFLDKVAVSGMRRSDEMYVELAQDPSFTFDIKSYLIFKLGTDDPMIKWSGDLGEGELHFMGAVNSLLLGVFDLVLAHNLDIDINNLNLPELPTADDDDDADGGILDPTTIETIDILLEWIYGLLTDPEHPDLLYLDADGVPHMQACGRELGSAILRFMALIDYTQARAANGEPNGMVYWDDEKGLVLVEGTLVLEPGLVEALKPMLLNLNMALFDTTAFDVDPANRNPFDVASANELLHYLAVLPAEISLPYGLITIDIGPWFQDPAPDGLRSLLFGLIDAWEFIKQILEIL